MTWLTIIGGVNSGACVNLGFGTWIIGGGFDADVVLVDLNDDERYTLIINDIIRLKRTDDSGDEGIVLKLGHTAYVGSVPFRLSNAPISMLSTQKVMNRSTAMASSKSANTSRGAYRFIATMCLTFLLVVNEPASMLKSITLANQSTTPSQSSITTLEASIPTLEGIVQKFNHSGADLTIDRNLGFPIVSGLVQSEADLEQFKQSLSAKDIIQTKFKLKIFDKIFKDALFAVEQMNMNLKLEARDMSMHLVGFLQSDDEHKKIIHLLEGEYSQGVPIKTNVVTGSQITEAFRSLISAANLASSWNINFTPDHIKIFVLLNKEENINRWLALLTELRQKFPLAQIDQEILSVPRLPAISGLKIERNSSIILRDGREIKVGSRLEQDFEVTSIDRTGLVLRKNNISSKLNFNSPPAWISWNEVRQ